MSQDRRQGEVINFPPPSHAPRLKRSGSPGAGGATVLLFTGVRYERLGADMPPASSVRPHPADDRRIGG